MDTTSLRTFARRLCIVMVTEGSQTPSDSKASVDVPAVPGGGPQPGQGTTRPVAPHNPVPPERFLETRTNGAGGQNAYTGASPVAAGSTIELPITGGSTSPTTPPRSY